MKQRLFSLSLKIVCHVFGMSSNPTFSFLTKERYPRLFSVLLPGNWRVQRKSARRISLCICFSNSCSDYINLVQSLDSRRRVMVVSREVRGSQCKTKDLNAVLSSALNNYRRITRSLTFLREFSDNQNISKDTVWWIGRCLIAFHPSAMADTYIDRTKDFLAFLASSLQNSVSCKYMLIQTFDSKTERQHTMR